MDPKTRRRAFRARMLVIVVAAVVGAGIGVAISPLSGLRPTSTAEVTLTRGPHAGDGGAGDGVQAQWVQARASGLAALAGTDLVRGRLGTRLAAADTVSGTSPQATQVVRVTVASDGSAGLRAKATAAAAALAGLVGDAQRARPGGVALTADVTSGGGPVEDLWPSAALQYGVLGAVLAGLLGMLGVELLSPGSWRRPVETTTPMSVAAGARQFAAEVERVLDRWWLACRTPRGVAVPVAALFAVLGYALTGWTLLPLLVVLAAGYVGLRDPRFAAAGIGLCGLTVLPVRLDLVRVGPVTPTVLEVAVVLGLLCTVLRPGAGAGGRSAFTPILLGVLASALLGALVGFIRGGDFATISEYTRALLTVTAFWVMYRAFRHRVAELVAMLLVGAAAACTLEIVAAFTGLSRLQADERTEVLTGADVADVTRLNSPVLMLCGPLLILLFSGVISHRNRWVMVALGTPMLAMEALSFNRSTWGPLLVAFVMIAGVCWGNRGIARRVTGLVLVGGLVLGLANAGALGSTGDALAIRVDSLISGNALQEDSLTDRLQENTAAWTTLRASPILGTGIGLPYGGTIISYDAVLGRTQIDPRIYMHNQYLRLWLLLGVAGLVAFGALGVRTIALVFLTWRRRAPGAPTVAALGFGLALVALQSIFQTTLVTREFVIGSATLLAALGAAASWQPGRLPAARASARALARRSFAGQWRVRTTGGDRMPAAAPETAVLETAAPLPVNGAAPVTAEVPAAPGGAAESPSRGGS